MKTLLIGDIHHGRKHNCTYGDCAIWDNKSLKILDQLLNKHEPDRLILAGDVFDSSKPSALAYAELCEVIFQCPNVWIIAGNHDISKVDEKIAFDLIPAFVVAHDTTKIVDDIGMIGWHATQGLFNEAMNRMLREDINILVTHCSRVDFGSNEMDNICTDEHIKLAKENGIVIISGHEHKSSLGNNFVHLGSVVPHTIAELGPRYYWLDGEFLKIPVAEDIVLTREEPLNIDPDKCYYIKTGKEVTTEDLKLESKDLTVDIISDFWHEAYKAGFRKEIIND